MKKLVLAALTAAIGMGAVAPAYAWTDTHCRTAADFSASSGTLANHCKQYIAGDGLISFGKHKNKRWQDVFSDYHFGKEVDHIEHNIKRVTGYVGGPVYKHTYTWKLKGPDWYGGESVKTKKLDQNDWDNYIAKYGKSKYKVVTTGDVE